MIKVHRPSSGFTLVEFLIYFGLMAVVMVVITDLFLSLLELKSESHSASIVAIDGQFLPTRLQYDVSHADAILQPAALGEASTQLKVMIDGAVITYSLQGTELLRTANSVTLPLLSGTDISELQFKRLGNVGGKHTIAVQYRLTSPIELPSGKHSLFYQTTLGVR